MGKYFGIIFGKILFFLAKLSANTTCIMLIYQPEEDLEIIELSNLEN